MSVDRGRPLDVAPSAPQRWCGTSAVSREVRPDFCCHGHRSRLLIGWEPGHGLYYACQVPGCPSVQYRY